MRKSRLAKCKKKKWSICFLLQLIVFFYLGMYLFTELTSPTNADFNDIERRTFSLKAADEFPEDSGEWDKSSLQFIGAGKRCEIPEIFAVIKNGNGSKPMKGSVGYEVYWINKGNPKDGEKVAEGTVPALGTGETYTIAYSPDIAGNYKFKAYQRPGHPGKGELWSDTIEVSASCLMNSTIESLNKTEPIDQDNAKDDSVNEGVTKDQPEKDTEQGDKQENQDEAMQQGQDEAKQTDEQLRLNESMNQENSQQPQQIQKLDSENGTDNENKEQLSEGGDSSDESGVEMD